MTSATMTTTRSRGDDVPLSYDPPSSIASLDADIERMSLVADALLDAIRNESNDDKNGGGGGGGMTLPVSITKEVIRSLGEGSSSSSSSQTPSTTGTEGEDTTSVYSSSSSEALEGLDEDSDDLRDELQRLDRVSAEMRELLNRDDKDNDDVSLASDNNDHDDDDDEDEVPLLDRKVTISLVRSAVDDKKEVLPEELYYADQEQCSDNNVDKRLVLATVSLWTIVLFLVCHSRFFMFDEDGTVRLPFHFRF